MKIALLNLAKPGGFLCSCKEVRRSQKHYAGNLLMVALIVMGVIGVLVIGCLSVARTQNVAVTRSQSWNACIPIIEAGVEEALAHLNNHSDTNITSDGWALVNGFYSQAPRYIGSDYYTVGIQITNPLRPMIVCTGYVALAAGASGATPTAFAAVGLPYASTGQTQYLARAVRVLAAKRPYYPKALVARDGIQMNGNGIAIDSFDSSDPLHSNPLNPGGYDPLKDKDNGDVATLSGLAGALGGGNANIKGHVRTGPGGTITLGPNGAAGSVAWNDGGSTGIQPGWSSDDMNVSFPPIDPPFSGTVPPKPVAGTIGGVPYTYVIGDGNYQIDKIALSGGNHLVVTGKVVLYVTGDISVSGSGSAIDIWPTASLNLYVGGSANFGGGGINNSQAGNFYYWGLPSNTAITMQANANTVAAIYAPNAGLTMTGGGSSIFNFIGSAVVRSIKINGHYNFHYDEALGKNGPLENFIVTSWVEL